MSAQSPVTGSLFAPFFFPLGIAFMGAQSAVMMKMAGENWQYGKRRISAMTNEDFNKMTPLKLYQVETAELRAMIPSIESSLKSMTPLTATIVTEMINTFKVGAVAAADYIRSFLDQFGETPLGHAIIIAIRIWFPWVTPLLENIASFVDPPGLIGPPEGSPLPPEGFPSPSPPPADEGPSDLDLENKKLEQARLLTQQLINDARKVIPKGSSKQDVLNAIKAWELQLKVWHRQLAEVIARPVAANQRALVKAINQRIKQSIQLIKMGKALVNYMNKNHLSVTP